MSKFNKNTDFRKISNEKYWEISGKQKICWDGDHAALFGSQIVKSSIGYYYIPAEFMEENIPYIIGSFVSYDGGKKQKEGMEKGDLCSSFKDLKNIFTLNNF